MASAPTHSDCPAATVSEPLRVVARQGWLNPTCVRPRSRAGARTGVSAV